MQIEVTGMKPRLRYWGFLVGERFWIDVNTARQTVNIPATGDIGPAGVRDLQELLSEAVKAIG